MMWLASVCQHITDKERGYAVRATYFEGMPDPIILMQESLNENTFLCINMRPNLTAISLSIIDEAGVVNFLNDRVNPVHN
jgi:hypothetical protein